MKPYRIVSNVVGFMLLVQVILGGIATLISRDYESVHIYWGVATFAVLIVATVYSVKALGTKSTLFRIGIAAIVDFIVQAALGLGILFNNYDSTTVVIHLTNAFILGIFVTNLISIADRTDKAAVAAATTKPL